MAPSKSTAVSNASSCETAHQSAQLSLPAGRSWLQPPPPSTIGSVTATGPSEPISSRMRRCTTLPWLDRTRPRPTCRRGSLCSARRPVRRDLDQSRARPPSPAPPRASSAAPRDVAARDRRQRSSCATCTVHDRFDVLLLDLDVGPHLRHTPDIHQRCRRRVSRDRRVSSNSRYTGVSSHNVSVHAQTVRQRARARVAARGRARPADRRARGRRSRAAAGRAGADRRRRAPRRASCARPIPAPPSGSSPAPPPRAPTRSTPRSPRPRRGFRQLARDQRRRARRRGADRAPRPGCASAGSSSRRSRCASAPSRGPRPTPTCARRSTSWSTTPRGALELGRGATAAPGPGRAQRAALRAARDRRR